MKYKNNIFLYLFPILTIGLMLCGCRNSNSIEGEVSIVSSDIKNFWKAYDNITSTTDSLKQRNYLKSAFIDKASFGQKKMIEFRNYTLDDYLEVINEYPLFWQSIRKNTLDSSLYTSKIKSGIDKLKQIYPDMTSSHIYLTMGAFRSSGTARDSTLLIGTEFAFGDLNTITTEFKGNRSHVVDYCKINPLEKLEFLTVHEYVHTQQKPIGNNLLLQTLYEGIAEFIACEVTREESPWPAFTYGPKNEAFIRQTFEKDLFNVNERGHWLWSSNSKFRVRDLGYYVGYTIAEKYYNKAKNKEQAIKEMIELDFNDDSEVEAFVDGSGYLTSSLESLYADFESSRPKILSIKQFRNGDQEVDAKINMITLEFTKPMNPNHRGFDFGPLGEPNAMKLSKYIGFSNDSLNVSFNVKLEPNRRYQLQLPNRFIDAEGLPLKPYLIDFKTK